MDSFLIMFLCILLYVIILLMFKFLGIFKKKTNQKCNNCCPDCDSALHRIKRKQIDFVIYHITFRMFNFKRYLCSECGWEGLRWESAFRT